jgi:hypothetical protein
MSTTETTAPYGGTIPPTLAPPQSITRETVVPPATTPTRESASLASTGGNVAYMLTLAIVLIACALFVFAIGRRLRSMSPPR